MWAFLFSPDVGVHRITINNPTNKPRKAKKKTYKKHAKAYKSLFKPIKNHCFKKLSYVRLSDSDEVLFINVLQAYANFTLAPVGHMQTCRSDIAVLDRFLFVFYRSLYTPCRSGSFVPKQYIRRQMQNNCAKPKRHLKMHRNRASPTQCAVRHLASKFWDTLGTKFPSKCGSSCLPGFTRNLFQASTNFLLAFPEVCKYQKGQVP